MSKVEISVVSDRYNPLLRRREVRFRVSHPHAPTPNRLEVRERLASVLNVDANRTFVTKMVTKTGTNEAQGYAEVYDSEEASSLVPEHIRSRMAAKQGK